MAWPLQAVAWPLQALPWRFEERFRSQAIDRSVHILAWTHIGPEQPATALGQRWNCIQLFELDQLFLSVREENWTTPVVPVLAPVGLVEQGPLEFQTDFVASQ